LRNAGPSTGRAAIAARLINVWPANDHATIVRGAASARTAAAVTTMWHRGREPVTS